METFLYEKIRDSIWQIAEDDGVYCTLIKGSKLAVLIDTGYGKRDLWAFVEKNISTPYIVINSHGHPDHIGGNYKFDTVYAAREEWDVIKHFDANNGMLYVLKEIQIGQRILLGDISIDVVSLAGHTKGSIGFIIPDEKILVAGDALNESLWLFNYGSLSMQELYETINAAMGLEFDSYLCGHSAKLYEKEKLKTHLRNIRNLKVDGNTKKNTIGFETYCSAYEDADGRSEIVFTLDKIENKSAIVRD